MRDRRSRRPARPAPSRAPRLTSTEGDARVVGGPVAVSPGRSSGPKGALLLSAGAAAAVRRGHPWVYADQVIAGLQAPAASDERAICDDAGVPIARAIVDPASPIAARIWSLDASRPIDDALVAGRIERAIALREALIDGDTTALRWVHGEGDRAPGIVIDRYADVAVLRLDGEAMERWTERIADVAWELMRPRGIRSLSLRATRRRDGRAAPDAATNDPSGGEPAKLRTLRGEPPPGELVVREHGVPFVVDLARGQKTGAFLDQRDNRRRVGALSRDRRVLNLFSYAGGFSLHAALSGARACTSVDVAAGAHVTAQRSFHAAGVPLDPHSFVTADVWTFLERARQRGERWDLIVSDPPNMAPSAATRARAISAYRKLHALCAGVLADGGILCAASCSSHVSLEDFLGTLDDAALGRSDLRVTAIAGAGVDHQTLAAFPEGRYLKFCVLG